jgi:endonuclease/exonuclease/phosphatase family metal-dependent hydrolase
LALLVRTWNVFHGNTSPPGRRSWLREMVQLATQDAPDVLCLQEVPVWALGRLRSWSGMQVTTAIARPSLRPVALAGWITRLHNGLLRSAIAGQANAILVSERHAMTDLGSVQVSSAGVERRVAHGVRLDAATVVANAHLTSICSRLVGEEEELDRVRAFAEGHARSGEPVVLAGDFNLVAPRLDGYSVPGPGIDHVLVRGATAGPVVIWPEERRVLGGRFLSDHAPVEAVVG